MVDVIVIAVILGIMGCAAWYAYRSKKKGRKCIGCPEGGCSQCSGGCQNRDFPN